MTVTIIKQEFYAQNVSITSIITELDQGCLILYDMNGGSNGLFPTNAHEVVILGYTEDDDTG